MIYLHTGCRYSKPWDDAFASILNSYRIQYSIINLPDVKLTNNDIFIGRIDQSCRHLKSLYKSLTYDAYMVWPEHLAIDLYDDKISQVDFLKSYPTPLQNVVYSESDVLLKFPIVQKLSHGASSKHVELIHSIKEVKYPSVHQEFCYDNDSDIRITVIGDYVTGFRRMNRPNDFRASGSNNIIIIDEIPKEIIDISLDICKSNNFITMAFDFLKLNGRWVIIEMSYTYQIHAITNYCNKYFDSTLNRFVPGVIDPTKVILDKILSKSNITYPL